MKTSQRRQPAPPRRPSSRDPRGEGRHGRTDHPAPLAHHGLYSLKRLLLGRPLSTQSQHLERLGKPTALAVFASDNLSSVAYATEEILRVGLAAGLGVLAFATVMPITLGILVILTILLFSYRQTIKAYPSAGGAYIVTKDNLGLIPAQVAGVALLTDYVLTVAVSVSAGVAAIVSAVPAAYPFRVEISVVFIWVIAWGNLRGVRESGRIFAVPTYFFIAMMGLLLGSGLVQAFTGGLHPQPIPGEIAETTGVISLFLILHAFASGGAAVTGVEAISNGVPAFKPPSWKNARTTLVWMGSLLGVMFLGLSFLAVKLHSVPTETKTVISEVGRSVFGTSGIGTVLFYALQIATMLILVLAANTAFADFPRLANFHAGDDFMPRQLTKRGHRLVYSNGILGLAVAATVLVVVFAADVTKLIPLYAIGVFTSFTLSQAGMAKRHVRIKEAGWRRGLAVNALGAFTTGLVTLVIAITKFEHGAWAVIVMVPLLVWLLVRMNHRYHRERDALQEGVASFDVSAVRPSATLVLVNRLDHETIHALQYAQTIRTSEAAALHVATPRHAEDTETLRREWTSAAIRMPLRIIDGTDHIGAVAEYVRELPDDIDVNVIVPSPARRPWRRRLLHAATGSRVTKALENQPQARITVVRDHPSETHADAGHPPRPRHIAVVLVDRIDRATLEAIRYARSLGAMETWGVHAAADLDLQAAVLDQWADLELPIPLQVVECWDRNIARSLETAVIEIMGEDGEVTVILPRRDYDQVRQRILHDRTSRSIAAALGRYAHVDVTVAPYRLRTKGPAPAPASATANS